MRAMTPGHALRDGDQSPARSETAHPEATRPETARWSMRAAGAPPARARWPALAVSSGPRAAAVRARRQAVRETATHRPPRAGGWARTLALGAALLGVLPPVFAQSGSAWPQRPLRVVVPFPPGSSADAAARVITVRMAEVIGQPVVVDNRSGASGNIGAEIVARAAPDGYTTLVGTTSTHAVAVSCRTG